MDGDAATDVEGEGFAEGAPGTRMSLVDAFDFPVAVNVIPVAVRKRVEAADRRKIAECFGICKRDAYLSAWRTLKELGCHVIFVRQFKLDIRRVKTRAEFSFHET